jgi:hypothetical protein
MGESIDGGFWMAVWTVRAAAGMGSELVKEFLVCLVQVHFKGNLSTRVHPARSHPDEECQLVLIACQRNERGLTGRRTTSSVNAPELRVKLEYCLTSVTLDRCNNKSGCAQQGPVKPITVAELLRRAQTVSSIKCMRLSAFIYKLG